MFRVTIFVLMLGLALALLSGCATTSGSNYHANNAEHGSVSDSVTIHFNCREETKSYRGDPNEIDMFKRCMERHGYAPDGKPLHKPASTSPSTSSEPASGSVKQRLQELNDLKANGLITEAEYDMKKAEVLKDL